jgi:translation initiation factor 2B subunit (eIF-2B alpha/beta/delta family)
LIVDPDIDRLIDEIRDNRTHGAIELARQALGVLRTTAENSQATTSEQLLGELHEIGQELMSARPAMAPIRNIVNRLLREISARVGAGDAGLLRKLTIYTVDEKIDESLRALAQIIAYGLELIAAGDRIMVHSFSSTVVAFLEEICRQRGGIEVVVTRSGPGRTGEAIARRLDDIGLPVTFIDDAAVGLYMPEVNRVLLGADTISAAGVVNGVGSYQVAVLAARHGVPVYVLADTLKFDATKDHRDFDTEDRDSMELADPADLGRTVSIRNPHFDITPLGMVTGVVTERGIMISNAVVANLNDQLTS